MPAYPRNQIVVADEVGVYHCVARCVRRAFLCGIDPATRHNYEHRKGWLRERLEVLASIFAIDICAYAVMSNHIHVILRCRPDLAKLWPAREIAVRWKRLYPPRDPSTRQEVEPSECDLNMILSNPDRVAELRGQLASLSWFMRCLSEPIARQANREDECTGRFWEGRFHSQHLADEAAVLACSAYVDLNPIRARTAETPETSQNTSVFDRIQSLLSVTVPAPATVEMEPVPLAARELAVTMPPPANGETEPVPPAARELAVTMPAPANGETEPVPPAANKHTMESSPTKSRRAAWLCELTIEESPNQQASLRATTAQESSLAGPSEAPESATCHQPASSSTAAACLASPPEASADATSLSGRPARASNQGYLPMSIDTYLSLVDWTGRQIRTASGGKIAAEYAPILERLGLNGDGWIETVRSFGRRFKRVVGRRESLKKLADRLGRRWFQGQRAAALAFL